MRSAFFIPFFVALSTCGVEADPMLGGLTDSDQHGTYTCAGGCETAPSMVDGDLSQEQYQAYLEAVSEEPLGTASHALENLLFHADATRFYLETIGAGPLSPEQLAFLEDELARTQVEVSFRVIGEDGEVHAYLEPTTIPLGEKQHAHLHTEGDLGDLEAGGTVRRVGLNHVWSRW